MRVIKKIDASLKQTTVIVSTFSEESYLAVKKLLDKKLSINTTTGIRLVYEVEIIYIESVRNYVEVHTESDILTVRMPLYKFQERLSNDFVKSSRSYLINFNKLSSLENDISLGVIAKVGKYKIPVSQTGLENLNSRIAMEK